MTLQFIVGQAGTERAFVFGPLSSSRPLILGPLSRFKFETNRGNQHTAGQGVRVFAPGCFLFKQIRERSYVCVEFTRMRRVFPVLGRNTPQRQGGGLARAARAKGSCVRTYAWIWLLLSEGLFLTTFAFSNSSQPFFCCCSKKIAHTHTQRHFFREKRRAEVEPAPSAKKVPAGATGERSKDAHTLPPTPSQGGEGCGTRRRARRAKGNTSISSFLQAKQKPDKRNKKKHRPSQGYAKRCHTCYIRPREKKARPERGCKVCCAHLRGTSPPASSPSAVHPAESCRAWKKRSGAHRAVSWQAAQRASCLPPPPPL